MKELTKCPCWLQTPNLSQKGSVLDAMDKYVAKNQGGESSATELLFYHCVTLSICGSQYSIIEVWATPSKHMEADPQNE